MAGRVEGKVALVTGAASGLGKAAAAMLLREGARVALTDRNEAGVREVAKALGESSLAWALDVTREQDWERVVDEVVATFGRLDVVVNNAGIGISKDIEALSLEECAMSGPGTGGT